jgi:2,3-bisphosphoglycerate-dependent phosphoglycerate mutase
MGALRTTPQWLRRARPQASRDELSIAGNASMKRLVLLRHGQSEWNAANRFTGWTDVPLSKRGLEEARLAALMLAEHDLHFDVAFTSVLSRAIKTLWVVLEHLDQMFVTVNKTWRLNERHYGALQGLDKNKVALEYGADQVEIWRRSYAVRPPAVTISDPRHPSHDRRYREINPRLLPATESLKDTLQRLLPCVREQIMPAFNAADTLLVIAHGNSLRAMIKYLDRLSDSEIANVDIPTALPLVYELTERLVVSGHYYFTSPTRLERFPNEPSIARASRSRWP